MLQKTILASGITLALALSCTTVQANPVTNMLSGFLNDIATVQQDARRGGSSRRSRSTSSVSRSSPTVSSSRAVAPTKSATTTSNTSTNNTTTGTTANNATATKSTTDQNDAQFSQNAYKGNTTGNQTVGNNMPTSNYQQPMMNQGGGMGMGANFLSSLAGAGAGVLLANMLLSPSAAAAQGTEIATPDMLSDTQIDECLTQIKTDLQDAEKRLLDAAPEDQAAIRDEISKMRDLEISLMSEQLNRLRGAQESKS